jgi:hypothetical protein
MLLSRAAWIDLCAAVCAAVERVDEIKKAGALLDFFDLAKNFAKHGRTLGFSCTSLLIAGTKAMCRLATHPYCTELNRFHLDLRSGHGLNDTDLNPRLFLLPAIGACVDAPMKARAGLLESDRLCMRLGSASAGVTYNTARAELHLTTAGTIARFVVLDCDAEVTFTDIIIPKGGPFTQLTIDVWSISEDTDAQRLILAHPLGSTPLNLTGLNVKARFIKLALNSDFESATHAGVVDLACIKGLCLVRCCSFCFHHWWVCLWDVI